MRSLRSFPISNDKQDALHLVEKLHYPVVHKIDTGSGSPGVELVKDQNQARMIVQQASSISRWANYSVYYKQKNYVYFQDFIPNDGHAIRVIICGNWAFG